MEYQALSLSISLYSVPSLSLLCTLSFSFGTFSVLSLYSVPRVVICCRVASFVAICRRAGVLPSPVASVVVRLSTVRSATALSSSAAMLRRLLTCHCVVIELCTPLVDLRCVCLGSFGVLVAWSSRATCEPTKCCCVLGRSHELG